MKRYNKEELLKICPVCGWNKLEQPPFETYGTPTYVICSCCGFEFGFDDESGGKSYVEYRKEWIDKGFPFFTQEHKPKGWNKEMMLEQLENIKKVKHYEPRYVMGKKDNNK